MLSVVKVLSLPYLVAPLLVPINRKLSPVACSLRQSCFRPRHDRLYRFPCNLAPDFTQYLNQRPNKSERHEIQNVERLGIFFHRRVTQGSEQFGAVTHILYRKASKFTIQCAAKTQTDGARWPRSIALAD